MPPTVSPTFRLQRLPQIYLQPYCFCLKWKGVIASVAHILKWKGTVRNSVDIGGGLGYVGRTKDYLLG